ncbi:CAT RNA binding domain-containing protein [Corticicoccus populi]|uniref:CAT RNA binding domain-containing protein n=1 Tax=Corticicoccus populi TaxID=1812821 RepID=A0ABW5WWJ5_9STAP
MKIKQVLNNNAVIATDNNQEVVVMGRGVSPFRRSRVRWWMKGGLRRRLF